MTSVAGRVSSPSTDAAFALGSSDDSMSTLYGAISNLRENEVASGQGRLAQDQADTKREEALERAAIQREQANAADSGGGFFSSIGHFVGDVVGDLAHGQIAGAVDDAGRDLSNAWNSPKFWSDLETGCEDVALVAAAASAAVVTAGAAGVAVGVGTAAAISALGAGAGAGARIAAGRLEQFAANAEDAKADGTAASHQIVRLQGFTDDVLSDLKQTSASHQRALQSLAQAIDTHDETAATPPSMTVKG